MRVINKIEKKRLIKLGKKKKFIKYPVILRGDYIIIWYINREKEKGIVRYQITKGICIDIKYKKYNSMLLLRSLIKGICIEKQFFYYSLNTLRIACKQNTIKYYRSNKLYVLRKKKNKHTRFIWW